MVGVVEDIARLIQKEASRMIEDKNKDAKKEIMKHNKECKEEYKQKLATAIKDYKQQHKIDFSDEIENQKQQISALKREHKVIIDKIHRENYEYVSSISEKVSKLYGVPIKKVRRDLASDKDIYCMGVKKDGRLCTNKAIIDGYCCLHVDENSPGTPVTIPSGIVRHNHPFPSGFVQGCPACEQEKVQSNEFRELPSII